MNRFYRTDENYIDRGTLSGTQSAGNSNWLSDLAESLLLKESIANSKKAMESMESNAVEVSRKRNLPPSMYEMMSSIISPQKPKFSSVEEVVQDYQNRTGLSEHLKQKEAHNMKAIAQNIMEDFNDAREVKTTVTKEIFDKEDCNNKAPNPFRTNMDYGNASDSNDASGKLSQKDLEELKGILYPTHGQKSVSEISDIHKNTNPKEFEHMLSSHEKSNADDGQSSEEDVGVSEEEKSVIESLKLQKQKFEEKRKKLEELIQQKKQSGSEALKKLEEDKKEIERLEAEIKQIQDVNSVFDGAMEKAKKKKKRKLKKRRNLDVLQMILHCKAGIIKSDIYKRVQNKELKEMKE